LNHFTIGSKKLSKKNKIIFMMKESDGISSFQQIRKLRIHGAAMNQIKAGGFQMTKSVMMLQTDCQNNSSKF